MPDKRQHGDLDDTPLVAIRRHTDRCFHAVEEVVYDGPPVEEASEQAGGTSGELSGGGGGAVVGYIIDGVMIDADDVAEVRHLADGGDRPACR